MARRRFVRRFAGRNKQPLSWVTTLFNETALVVSAADDTTQILLDSTDWNANIASTRKLAHVHRIVYNGVLGIIPLTTTFASDFVSIIWACLIADADDTDEMGSTAAGGVLASNRIVASGIVGAVMYEIAGGTTVDFQPMMKIEVDTKVRAKLQPDEQLQMRYRFQTDATGVISLGAVSAFSRVLISEP